MLGYFMGKTGFDPANCPEVRILRVSDNTVAQHALAGAELAAAGIRFMPCAYGNLTGEYLTSLGSFATGMAFRCAVDKAVVNHSVSVKPTQHGRT